MLFSIIVLGVGEEILEIMCGASHGIDVKPELYKNLTNPNLRGIWDV